MNIRRYNILVHERLTSRIIGAAYKVHNALGSGFQEPVYRNALACELESQGLHVAVECPIAVSYGDRPVGECRSDLVVEGLLVLELKAQDALLPGHHSQLRAYLRASGMETGLLLNFGPRKVDVKRVSNSSEAERA